MAQNVTLLGASYADVPAVQLPKTGGGTALFADPSITTAVAADVAQGKNFLLADGSIGTGTASGGGGGASNIVQGTFKGTTTGTAMDVSISYSGSGYPIAFMVFPSEGSYHSGGTFFTLVERYAVDTFVGVKNSPETAATYVSSSSYKSQNAFVTDVRYKSSTSNSSSFSTSAASQTIITSGQAATSPSGTPSAPLRFKDKKTLSVYIGGSNYHFAANIEYTYAIIYSS